VRTPNATSRPRAAPCARSASKRFASMVRDALGHSSITMTDTYLQSRIDRLDKAFGKLHRRSLKLVKRA
jgi:hypothetical protein